MRQLYLSSLHLCRENTPAFVEVLNRYRITHLISYSSSAATLARDILDLGLRVYDLQVVFTNAEPLFPWQKDLIQQGLGARTIETYGMTEAVAAGSQCAFGQLHFWPESGCLEVLQDAADQPVSNGEAGRFVCTGLLNHEMPLIRYEVGDRGSRPTFQTSCSCGRSLPALSRIEGRTNDMLLTPDGRKVYWLNSVFYGLPVVEAQIIQEALDRVRVKYLPGRAFNQDSARLLEQRLKTRLGEVSVTLEPTAHIPRGANGKFRAIVSLLAGERPRLEQVG